MNQRIRAEAMDRSGGPVHPSGGPRCLCSIGPHPRVQQRFSPALLKASESRPLVRVSPLHVSSQAAFSSQGMTRLSDTRQPYAAREEFGLRQILTSRQTEVSDSVLNCVAGFFFFSSLRKIGSERQDFRNPPGSLHRIFLVKVFLRSGPCSFTDVPGTGRDYKNRKRNEKPLKTPVLGR